MEGKVTLSENYCGGARISDEELIAITKTKPYVNYTVYIRKGESNSLEAPIIDSVKTDFEGKFRIELPKGKYVLLSKHQINTDILGIEKKMKAKITDLDCIKKWWGKGLAEIEMVDRAVSVNFHIQRRCYLPEGVPCLKYTGPIHP